MNPLGTFWQKWCDFFFKPSSTLPLSVFRIIFGLLALEAGALIAPDLLTWYGIHGSLRPELAEQIYGKLCVDWLLFLPRNDESVIAFFCIYMLSALFVCLGLFTRFSMVILYFTLSSFHFRNPQIINSGDDLLRVYSFFMMFAPAGEQLSLDHVLKKRKQKKAAAAANYETDDQTCMRSLWPQRLIQIEITLIYMQYFLTKMMDSYWLDGTAVYYVLASTELQRFPVMFERNNVLISQILTYFTLVAEFALCALIWVKSIRYWVLLSGILLHLGLEYCLNIPIFQHVILASYILFIDEKDLQRVLNWLKKKCSFSAKT